MADPALVGRQFRLLSFATLLGNVGRVLHDEAMIFDETQQVEGT